MKGLALVFPGQGSQYAGMGRKLCERYAEARQVFEEAGEIFGMDMKRMCIEAGIEELTRTGNAQPAILTASVAAFRVFMKEFRIRPSLSAGHSLGEYTALTCAGSIGFSDCLRIVRERGRLMQEAAEGSEGCMLAVIGLARETVEDECRKMNAAERRVFISNYNSPMQTVISGARGAVEKAGKRLEDMGGKAFPLKVSAAFHSPMMQFAADRLLAELKKYDYKPSDWPVISNVSARPFGGGPEIISGLVSQTVKPVRWQESMEYMKESSIKMLVEIGPGEVLKKLAVKNILGIRAFSFDNDEDAEKLSGEISDSRLSSGREVITQCIKAAVCTQNRNWNNEEYRDGVVLPLREIKLLLSDLGKEERAPSYDEVRRAVDMLTSVFRVKKVPVRERKEWLDDIRESAGTEELVQYVEMLKSEGEEANEQ